jgi:hypothetical protein
VIKARMMRHVQKVLDKKPEGGYLGHTGIDKRIIKK